MTRQIKFRVWTGSTMEENVLVGKLGAFYASKDSTDAASAVTTLYPENITMMQFTGLKDKNGTEIYEGDIVRGVGVTSYGKPIIRRVAYDDKSARFGLADVKGNITFEPLVWISFPLEIIGNIFENPELLEVKN